MTPERKKKLRVFLIIHWRELNGVVVYERRRIIEERCGQAKNLDNANEDALKQICKDYYERSFLCEPQKWDLEYVVLKRDDE
ncbi:hypothetical protein QYM36_011589, partial [Artemia franciscana]